MLTRRLLPILLTLACVLPLWGQTTEAKPDTVTLRPVFAAYALEVGGASLTDTYLTPIKYSGSTAAFDYRRYQAMRFDPRGWTMQLHLGLSVDRTENPVGNATMWAAMLRADWSMMRKFRPLPNLTLAVGPGIGLDLGCLYTSRNGNNPASAKAALTLNASGFASYRFKIKRLPVTLTYQALLPVTGVFFAPDYGELYYEIYLGDHAGLAHAAWWGNYLSYDQLLSADLHFGSTSLRIGYHGHIFSSKVNDIVTNMYTHAFTLGVAGEWISVNPRKGIPAATRMINALY